MEEREISKVSPSEAGNSKRGGCMNHEDDLKAKVRELFQQVVDHLDPQLDKLILSGCGVVDDHARCNGGYLVAKAFLCAFLQNEKDRIEPSRIIDRFDELLNNYEKFI